MTTKTLFPTNEILIDPEAHKVMLCSWCQKYFDPETKKYVSKPEKSSGDSICPSCMSIMMEELNNDRDRNIETETC